MFNQTFSSIRLGEKEIRANFDCFAKLWCQGDSQASQKIDFFSNVFGEPDLLLFLHYILCLLGTVHILATPPSIPMVLSISEVQSTISTLWISCPGKLLSILLWSLFEAFLVSTIQKNTLLRSHEVTEDSAAKQAMEMVDGSQGGGVRWQGHEDFCIEILSAQRV